METNWLSDEQQRIWRSYLRATSRIQNYLDHTLRAFGIGLSEYVVLAMLSEADGRRLRMSELAEAADQSRSRLTHTVTRLEQAGHIARVTCAADGRGVWAEMTDQGYEFLAGMAPQHVAAVRRILIDAVDPADLAALGRAMDAVCSVAD